MTNLRHLFFFYNKIYKVLITFAPEIRNSYREACTAFRVVSDYVPVLRIVLC